MITDEGEKTAASFLSSVANYHYSYGFVWHRGIQLWTSKISQVTKVGTTGNEVATENLSMVSC